MRQFSDYKTVSVPQSQILAGLKTIGLVGLWATFEGSFLCFGGQKIKKCFSNRIEKLHKMAFIYMYIYIPIYIFFFEKFWKSWKNWNYLHKIFFTMYSICYTREPTYLIFKRPYLQYLAHNYFILLILYCKLMQTERPAISGAQYFYPLLILYCKLVRTKRPATSLD